MNRQRRLLKRAGVILMSFSTGLACASISGVAMAEITVDKSQGLLSVNSDINGTVVVKIIGPDDVVVVDESYAGNSFDWAPSSGPDGAYRYDVRVIEESNEVAANTDNQDQQSSSSKSDYAGGSVEVTNGTIAVTTEVE